MRVFPLDGQVTIIKALKKILGRLESTMRRQTGLRTVCEFMPDNKFEKEGKEESSHFCRIAALPDHTKHPVLQAVMFCSVSRNSAMFSIAALTWKGVTCL